MNHFLALILFHQCAALRTIKLISTPFSVISLRMKSWRTRDEVRHQLIFEGLLATKAFSLRITIFSHLHGCWATTLDQTFNSVLIRSIVLFLNSSLFHRKSILTKRRGVSTQIVCSTDGLLYGSFIG